MKADRKRRRCPVCQSINLYKRSWATLWQKKSKMKDKYDKKMIKALESKTKKYRCMNCKSEFDAPLDIKEEKLEIHRNNVVVGYCKD